MDERGIGLDQVDIFFVRIVVKPLTVVCKLFFKEVWKEASKVIVSIQCGFITYMD